ncbi:MAG: hypothetical protein RBJ76_04945 [Stenomitos frigidus ULC029]
MSRRSRWQNAPTDQARIPKVFIEDIVALAAAVDQDDPDKARSILEKLITLGTQKEKSSGTKRKQMLKATEATESTFKIEAIPLRTDIAQTDIDPYYIEDEDSPELVLPQRVLQSAFRETLIADILEPFSDDKRSDLTAQRDLKATLDAASEIDLEMATESQSNEITEADQADISEGTTAQLQTEPNEAIDIRHLGSGLTTEATLITLVEALSELEQEVPVRQQSSDAESKISFQEVKQQEVVDEGQAVFDQLNVEPELIEQMETEALNLIGQLGVEATKLLETEPCLEEPDRQNEAPKTKQAVFDQLNVEPELIGQMETGAPNLIEPLEEPSTSCPIPGSSVESQKSGAEPTVSYTLITTTPKLEPQLICPIKAAPSQAIVQLPTEAVASLWEEKAETIISRETELIEQNDLTRQPDVLRLFEQKEKATDVTFEQRSLDADQLDCQAADRLEAYARETPLAPIKQVRAFAQQLFKGWHQLVVLKVQGTEQPYWGCAIDLIELRQTAFKEMSIWRFVGLIEDVTKLHHDQTLPALQLIHDGETEGFLVNQTRITALRYLESSVGKQAALTLNNPLQEQSTSDLAATQKVRVQQDSTHQKQLRQMGQQLEQQETNQAHVRRHHKNTNSGQSLIGRLWQRLT